MSNAMTRSHSGDRFYNPPAVRRHQQMMLQKQLQRPLPMERRVDSSEAEERTNSDESTLSRSNLVCLAAPTRDSNLTTLDRLMESVTPFVSALHLSEAKIRGSPFFCLGDLWESFKEWSVYGVGVPLLLNGSDCVKQYYVPSLSGIQLYVDPCRLRRHGEDTDVGSSGEASSAGSSDCETEKRVKGGVDGAWGQQNLVNLNSQRLHQLSLREKPSMSSSSDETEICNSHGLPVFEYLEQEQPHRRQPLYDKVSNLASQFPEIKLYRSCDLLPASWVSVAWYPIYRIPMGPTLQNLDASFLTFHSLSTHSRSKNQVLLDAPSGRTAYVAVASKIALPVFGLASYKLRGSILTQSGAHEWQQANSLLQAADNWLRSLEVKLPDFQFFASHNSQWR